MKRALLALALTSSLAVHAFAAETPRPGTIDPRIQSVEYDPDQVVVVQGAMGNQIMVEFGPGERLENVAIGDSLGWQVTPNKRADLLFLKPLDMKSVTNMTVVTSERSYFFQLRAAPRTEAAFTPYAVRFTYAPPVVVVPIPPEPEKPPEVVNTDYVVAGAQTNRPLRVFDDGHMVYFEWPADALTPAIFAVGADNSESLVNYVVRGPYVVVDQLSGRFVLRYGKQVATVTNRAFAPTKVAGAAR